MSGPRRYYHYSPHRFQPGDEILPASKLTPEQWAVRPEYFRTNDNLHLPTYDPARVYMFDDRHLDADCELPPDFYDWNLYEVEPRGQVEPDAEAVALQHSEPEWYHPYAWQAPSARVLRLAVAA
jgi:hypothetical protein